MMEMAWVALIMVLLVVVSAVALLPWIELIEVGRWIMLAGVAVGVPLEVIYFFLLRSFLIVSGERPHRWWSRPFLHHDRLKARHRILVLPFYFGGASAFMIAIFGAVLVAIGVVGAIQE